MTAMQCRQAVQSMNGYVSGALPPARRTAFERHLRRCPRCTEFLLAYRAVPGIVRRLTAARMPDTSARRLKLTLAALPPRSRR